MISSGFKSPNCLKRLDNLSKIVVLFLGPPVRVYLVCACLTCVELFVHVYLYIYSCMCRLLGSPRFEQRCLLPVRYSGHFRLLLALGLGCSVREASGLRFRVCLSTPIKLPQRSLDYSSSNVAQIKTSVTTRIWNGSLVHYLKSSYGTFVLHFSRFFSTAQHLHANLFGLYGTPKNSNGSG